MSKNNSKIKNIQYFLACLFLASLNFEMFSPFVEKFSVAKMAAYLYLAGLLLSPKGLLSVKNIEIPLFSIIIMFILMVASSIVHTLQNTSFFSSTVFLNIITFWLLLNHCRRDNRIFHEGFLWFSMSCFVMGVLYYQGIGIASDNIGRVSIFGDNSNDTGVKMAIGILFLLNYCIDHPTAQSDGNSKEIKIYRPWLLLFTIPMFLLLFGTASRTALLVLVAGSVLFVLLRNTGGIKKKIPSLVVGIVALVIGYSVISKQDVVMARMNDTIEEGSLSGRDEIWNVYLPFIEEHPLIGTGFTGHYNYAIAIMGRASSPHNVLIEVALYSGIIGLFFFLVFLYNVFIDAWKYKKKKNNLGPLITSMAIVGMVLSGQALGVKLFWALAAYALSYRFEYNNNYSKIIR